MSKRWKLNFYRVYGSMTPIFRFKIEIRDCVLMNLSSVIMLLAALYIFFQPPTPRKNFTMLTRREMDIFSWEFKYFHAGEINRG